MTPGTAGFSCPGALDPPMTRTEAVRAYYRALDAGEYDRLADLLAPDFRQERPDRTFEGREAFVRFVRADRPRTDTRHAIDAVYVGESDEDRNGGGDGDGRGEGGDGDRDRDRGGDVAVEGRLVTEDGELLVTFADAFAFDGDEIARLRTYTR